MFRFRVMILVDGNRKLCGWYCWMRSRWVRCYRGVLFAAIVDVGTASFKYDMRRLSEILAFPKAWYRRTIVRRLFLGDAALASAHHPWVPATHHTYIHTHSPHFFHHSPIVAHLLKYGSQIQMEVQCSCNVHRKYCFYLIVVSKQITDSCLIYAKKMYTSFFIL